MLGFKYDAILELQRIIKDDVKHVRTPAGVRRFKLPIGAPIVPGTGEHLGFNPAGADEGSQSAEEWYETQNLKADVAQKIENNRLVNAYLMDLRREHPDDPFSKHVESDDFGNYVDLEYIERTEVANYRKETDQQAQYFELAQQADAAAHEVAVYERQMEALQAVIHDNPDEDLSPQERELERTKTQHAYWNQRYKDLQEALQNRFPDGVPLRDTRTDEAILNSDEFRKHLAEKFGDPTYSDRNFDFNQTGFKDLNHLSNKEFAREIAIRRQIAQITRSTIDGWAATSLDHDENALTLQYAVQQRFDVAGWESVLDYLAHRNMSPAQANDPKNAEYIKERRDYWESKIKEKYAEDKPILDGMVEAFYQVQQHAFADAGVTEVSMYRGMSLPTPAVQALPELFDPDKGEVFNFNPLCSWAWDTGQAEEFSARRADSEMTGVIFRITVPVDRVFSSAVTGLGCRNEHEFVLVGGDYRVHAVKWDPVAHEFVDHFGALVEEEPAPVSQETYKLLDEYNAALWDHPNLSHGYKQKITNLYESAILDAKSLDVLYTLRTMAQEEPDMPNSVFKALIKVLNQREKDVELHEQNQTSFAATIAALEPDDEELASNIVPFGDNSHNALDDLKDALIAYDHPATDKIMAPFITSTFDVQDQSELMALSDQMSTTAVPASIKQKFFKLLAHRNDDLNTAAMEAKKKHLAAAAANKPAAKKAAPAKKTAAKKTVWKPPAKQAAAKPDETGFGQWIDNADNIGALIGVSNQIDNAYGHGDISKPQYDDLMAKVKAKTKALHKPALQVPPPPKPKDTYGNLYNQVFAANSPEELDNILAYAKIAKSQGKISQAGLLLIQKYVKQRRIYLENEVH